MTFAELEVMLIAMTFKLLVASIAFAGVRMAIANMDKAFKIDVKGWLNNASDVARAQYFGLRLLATCILFGLVFSY